MISFLIPLRSKITSKNWDLTQHLLNNTLKSVFNQIDPEFRVFIACHELPELDREYDDRLTIFQVDYPPPGRVEDQLTDKYYKKRHLVRMVQDIGGRYIMFVDSDDYVSNRLVTFVKAHEHPSGWVIDNGWELDAGKNLMRPTPKFNNICGTSAILNISVLQYPVDTTFSDYKRENIYLFDFGHNEWNQILDSRNEPRLAYIPFRAAVYVINNGTNWTNDSGQRIGFVRQFYRRIFQGKPVSETLRNEFGI